MPYPEFGTAFSVPYEFYASRSGLLPKTGYTKDQHEFGYFRAASGMSMTDPLPLMQRAVWRANSGLTPVDNFNDTDHFNAYYNQFANSAILKQDQFNQRTLVNWATNPEFKRVSTGSTVMRRNRAIVPQANATWSGDSGTGGVVTNTYENTLRKVTWTTQPTAGNARIGAGQTIVVTPGEVITVSMDMASSGGLSNMLVDMLDSGGTFVTLLTSPGVVQSSNTAKPSRPSLTFTVPNNVGRIRVYHRWAAASYASPGAWLAAGNLLIEARPGALPYFDGASSGGATGIVYTWEGAANASESNARANALEVRRNIAVTPRAGTFKSESVGAIGFSNARYPSNGTYSTVNGWYRYTRTVVANAAYGFHLAHNPEATFSPNFTLPVTAGQTLTFSMLGRVNTGSATVRLNYRFGSSVTGDWTAGVASMNISVVGNASSSGTLIAGTVTIPAGVDRLSVYLVSSEIPENGYLEVTQLLAEFTNTVQPFFDGDLTPDAELTPTWTGTAGTSASTLSGLNPAVPTYGGTVVRTWNNPSARFISKVLNGGNEAMFFGAGGFNNLNVMKPGKTYTAMATLTLPQALSATGANSLRIMIRWAGTVNGSVMSEPAPNVPGTHQLRVTGTIPATGVTGTMVVLGTYGPGETYWSNVAVVDGEYAGPFFDGDTPGALWTGVEHNSTSAKRAF